MSGAIGQPQVGMFFPALSPDGGRVAVTATVQNNADIWMHDTVTGAATRLTFDPANDAFPAWSPDGLYVSFHSFRSGNGDIFMRRADGTGAPETLVAGPEGDFWPDWSRDGRYLVFIRGQTSDLWYVPVTSDRTAVPFLETPHNETHPALSPDGRYVAYDSNESGRSEVYVRPFPSGEGRWQISVNGGNSPRWNGAGTEIFFVESGDQFSGTTLMAAAVQTRPVFRRSAPEALFTAGAVGASGFGNKRYDVSPDGQRFVVLQTEAGDAPAQPAVTLAQDWAAAFEKP